MIILCCRSPFLIAVPKSSSFNSTAHAYAPYTPPALVGTEPSAPNMDGDTTGPWSYNDMLRIVSHEAPSCELCGEWAQHYLKAALRSDRSLRDAEVQRSAVLNAPLLTETALLREKLSSADAETALLREKLSSANAEIVRLRELNTNIDRDADEAIRDLKAQIRDLERGTNPRRRKVPRHRSRSRSPPTSHSRPASRPASPMLEDRDASPAPSSAAPPYLLARMDMSAAASPAHSPVDPSPAGGNLASRLADAVSLEPPAPDPAPATTRLAATTFYAALGFPSLHPVVSFSDHQYHCTARDAAGNINVDADSRFVYATGRLSEDGPAWSTSLITRDYLEEESTQKALAAALPLPIHNVVWGGRNGVLISALEDPSSEEAITTLLTTPRLYPKAAAYIERVQHTPPELREAIHQRALDRWLEMQAMRHRERKERGEVAGRPREPMPYNDLNTWKKWLRIMRDHPHSEGRFKFPGVPCVCKGYQVPHIEGVRALLEFLPRRKGSVVRGPLRDVFLRNAAILLCVPEQYQRVTTQIGVTITTPRRKQMYSTTQFGNETRLGVNDVARYFAYIGVTTDEAESWRAWAAAYIDMELEERPTSTHAQLLQQAREQARARINNDPNWVLTRVHITSPGYYNPATENSRAQRNTRRATERAPATFANAEAGPSSVPLDGESHMHHADDAQEEEVVRLGYGDDQNEDDRMGPG